MITEAAKVQAKASPTHTYGLQCNNSLYQFAFCILESACLKLLTQVYKQATPPPLKHITKP